MITRHRTGYPSHLKDDGSAWDRSHRRHLNLRAAMAVVAGLIVAATGFGWVQI